MAANVNILWRHYTYVETHSKFIRAIFCNVTLYYYKLEVCHHTGVRNMFERRVLLTEELNGKLRIVMSEWESMCNLKMCIESDYCFPKTTQEH